MSGGLVACGLRAASCFSTTQTNMSRPTVSGVLELSASFFDFA